MTRGWTEAEWDTWFREQVEPCRDVLDDLDNAIAMRDTADVNANLMPGDDTSGKVYEDTRDYLNETYGPALTAATKPLVSGGPDQAGYAERFRELTTQQKHALHEAWSTYRSGPGADEPAVARPTSTGKWVMYVSIVAILVVLAILVMSFGGGSGTEDAVGVDDAAGAPSEDADISGAAGISARPEADEPATLTLAGTDVCGNLAAMEDAGVDLAAGPGQEGGRINFVGGASDPAALTGVLSPGEGGPTWEDRSSLDGGVADEQLLENVVIGQGTITGSLVWTNHDGCTTTLDATLAVPTGLTDWLLSLPPAGPSDYQFTGDLTEGPEDLVVNGVLVDAAGVPVAGQEVTVEVFGSEGGLDTYTAVTGADGSVRVEIDSPPGDRSSISAQVVKDAHTLASLFLE